MAPIAHRGTSIVFIVSVVLAVSSNAWRARPAEWIKSSYAIYGGDLVGSFVFKTGMVYRPYFTYLFMAKHMKGKEIVVFDNDFVVNDFLASVGKVRVVTGIPYRHTLTMAERNSLLRREKFLFVNRTSLGQMVEFYFVEPRETYGHARYYLTVFQGEPEPAAPQRGRQFPTNALRYFLVPEALLKD